MFVKSILAVAAVASLVSFASTSAKADPSFSFGIGIGSGFDEPFRHRRFDDGFRGDYPPPPFFPRRDRRFMDYPPRLSYGVSCAQGRSIVSDAGYDGVRAYRCAGSTYGYRAWRDGERFQVLVNRRGDIISERPLY